LSVTQLPSSLINMPHLQIMHLSSDDYQIRPVHTSLLLLGAYLTFVQCHTWRTPVSLIKMTTECSTAYSILRGYCSQNIKMAAR